MTWVILATHDNGEEVPTLSDINDIEQNDAGESDAPAWWSPSALLTTPAAATTAFALAVFSMLGQGSWTIAAQSLFGASFAPDTYGWILATGGVTSLAMAAAAVGLSSRVLTLDEPVSSWDGHLARAAVLVAALGGLFSVLTIVAGALQR